MQQEDGASGSTSLSDGSMLIKIGVPICLAAVTAADVVALRCITGEIVPEDIAWQYPGLAVLWILALLCLRQRQWCTMRGLRPQQARIILWVTGGVTLTFLSLATVRLAGLNRTGISDQLSMEEESLETIGRSLGLLLFALLSGLYTIAAWRYLRYGDQG